MPTVLSWTGLALVLVAGVLYAGSVSDTGARLLRLPEPTRPHRITWCVLTVIAGLGLWSTVSGGAGLGALVPAEFFVVALVVTLLSFLGWGKPGAEGGVLDWLLGGIALGVLLLWQLAPFPAELAFLKSAALAATVAWIVDGAGACFTIREPSAEPWWIWGLDALGSACAVAAITLAHPGYSALAYPVYLVIGNGAIAYAAYKHQRTRRAPNAPVVEVAGAEA